MYAEKRKLHLISELLKIENADILQKLESIINEATKTSKKSSFKDFSGIWTKEEANQISREIEAGCETVNPDDWK